MIETFEERLARLKDIGADLRAIAVDMRHGASETEKLGPGVIVDYQLGKTGRGGYADINVIEQAATALDTLQRENARLKAPLTHEDVAVIMLACGPHLDAAWSALDKRVFADAMARQTEGKK